MKLIKIITIALLLAICFNKAKAQTKEETEKWIVEKINKYMATKISGTRVYGYATKEPASRYEKLLVWYMRFKNYTPTNFSIQGGKIVVSYTYKISEKPMGDDNYKFFDSHLTDKVTLSENRIIKTDVYTIDTSFTSIDVCDPYINSEKDACAGAYQYLLAIKLKCPCGELTISNGKTEQTNYLFLFIDGNEEPDLVTRLQTALARLKTFYPKPKETF